MAEAGAEAARRAAGITVVAGRLQSFITATFVTAALIGLVAVGANVPAYAATIKTQGYAVGAPGGTTQVGNTETFGDKEWIEFYIPLLQIGGTYGVGSNCANNGTCSSVGFIGGDLTMHLRFDFGQQVAAGDKALTLRFKDLDLIGMNDPWYHAEAIKVGSADWVYDVGSPLVSGNQDVQMLSMILEDLPAGDDFWVTLKFAAGSLFPGRNAAEYLLAKLEATPVPLPAALWLFASALAWFGGLSGFRQWRASRLRTA